MSNFISKVFLASLLFLLVQNLFGQYKFAGREVYPQLSNSVYQNVISRDTSFSYILDKQSYQSSQVTIKICTNPFQIVSQQTIQLSSSNSMMGYSGLDNNGNLLFSVTNATHDSLTLYKVDSTGSLLWSTVYNSSNKYALKFTITSLNDLFILYEDILDNHYTCVFNSSGQLISDFLLDINPDLYIFDGEYSDLTMVIDDYSNLYVSYDSVTPYSLYNCTDYSYTKYLYKFDRYGNLLWMSTYPYTLDSIGVEYLRIDNLYIIGDTIVTTGVQIYGLHIQDGDTTTVKPIVIFWDTLGNILNTYVAQDSAITFNEWQIHSSYGFELIGKGTNGNLLFVQGLIDGGNSAIGPFWKLLFFDPSTFTPVIEYYIKDFYDPNLTLAQLTNGFCDIQLVNYPANHFSLFISFAIEYSTFSENYVNMYALLDPSGNIIYTDTTNQNIYLPLKPLIIQNGTIYNYSFFGNSINHYPVKSTWCYGCSENVTGRMYSDTLNDCLDTNDPPFPTMLLSVDSGQYYYYTNANGNYQMILDSGPHTIEPVVTSSTYWHSNCIPLPLAVAAPNQPNISIGNDLPLEFIPNVHDIKTEVTGTQTNPGYQAATWISLKNLGTTIESGTLTFTYTDSIFITNTVVPTPDSVGTGFLSWNYAGINPNSTTYFMVYFDIPSTVALSSGFQFQSVGGDVSIDTSPANNADTYTGVVTGSWDPNDKQVWPIGIGTQGFITTQDSLLEYLVRFQNTGTDTARNIRVEDYLDEDLDLSTLQIGIASHPYSVQLNGRKLIFTFDNIMLPDSGANFAASNGLIQYFIEQKPGLPIGTEIKNVAAIYFDFNAPVITNMVTNTIDWATEVEEPISVSTENKLVAYPNPFSGKIEILWDYKEAITKLTLWNIYGQQVKDFTYLVKGSLSGKSEIGANVSDLSGGIYFLKLETSNSTEIIKLLKY